MTKREQIIAIAKVCGWKFVGMRGSKTHGYFYLNIKDSQVPIAERGHLKGATHFYDLPDYLNDLNVMCDTEGVLTNNQRREYSKTLYKVHPLKYNPFEGDDGWMRVFFLVHATATQRAEALLKTLGLWKS